MLFAAGYQYRRSGELFSEMISRISFAHVEKGKFSGSVWLLEKSAKYCGAAGASSCGISVFSISDFFCRASFSISAAKKPFFGREYRYPSEISCAQAFSTVITLTPRFSAKLRFEGSFSHALITPETISSRMHLYRYMQRLSSPMFSKEQVSIAHLF